MASAYNGCAALVYDEARVYDDTPPHIHTHHRHTHLSQHCHTPGCVMRKRSGTLMKVRMMM
jgi:hypothetical protein